MTVSQSALCALRVLRKVPELADHFLDKAKALLHDRNHGVLLAGVTLVTEMCHLEREVCDSFKKVRLFSGLRLDVAELDLANRQYPCSSNT
jgi:hypothetical protein